MVRVRFAPSPTGIPHIGNTRTALFNFLFAKHNNGKLILRIEDTDRERFVKKTEDAIYEILNWLEIPFDEKYIQSERLEIYKEHANILKNKKFAYEDDGAIRFRMPKEGVTLWKDEIGQREISFKNETQEDFVIIKSDGFPTYNFANVVDDHLIDITHVIRGEEFISSTPKHIQLYKAFGWKEPIFAHLPIILGTDKTKLSKRHGAKSVLEYRKEGYLKETLLNFMALLGWNPGGDKEIFSLSEMIKLFDLKDINSANPVFDAKKLEWMNGVYIRLEATRELTKEVKNKFNKQLNNIDDEMLHNFVGLAKSRAKTLNDFYDLIKPFAENLDIKLEKKEKLIAKKLLEYLMNIGKWQKDNIFLEMKKVLVEEKIRMPILYKILTGRESGLPLPDSLEILGKEKTTEKLKRLSTA